MKSPQRKVSRMKYCPNMHDGGMPSATVDLPQPPSYNKFGTNSVLSWFTTLLLLEDKFSKIWQSNEFQIARITVRKVWASRPFCSFVLYVPTESVKRVIPMGREWPAKIICSAVRRNISPQRSRNLWKALSTDSVQSMMVVALLRIRKHRLSHDIYALRRVASPLRSHNWRDYNLSSGNDCKPKERAPLRRRLKKITTDGKVIQ